MDHLRRMGLVTGGDDQAKHDSSILSEGDKLFQKGVLEKSVDLYKAVISTPTLTTDTQFSFIPKTASLIPNSHWGAPPHS